MPQPLCTTLDEALSLCVDALGGPKSVGMRLWPEMDPILARERLRHALKTGRRERLSLAQVFFILREAKAAGEHQGFEQLAVALGYRVTAVVDEREAVADLARQAKQAAEKASELSAEMLARAEALHLDVDSVIGR